MKMNIKQTKLIGLTMELELKAIEYKKLCKKLEKLKENNINVNSPMLVELKESFQKNHDEIVEINRQIKELKTDEELAEKRLSEKYNPDNLFKAKNTKKNEAKKADIVPITKKNIFQKILEKLKKII